MSLPVAEIAPQIKLEKIARILLYFRPLWLEL
jgi:hypothetical protein